jgi:CRISPR/Cas system CMR-associated protein Cmr5 small subunit
MESTINEMLSQAISVIANNRDIKGKENDSNKIEGIYESYLSQFGPMVVQMELPCTIAVYNTTKIKRGGDRQHIIHMLYAVISAYSANYVFGKPNHQEWAKYLMTQPLTEDTIDIVLDASVALKRAIRTFPLTSKKDEE